MLIVAIAFIVYDRVMTSQQVPMVENSRSAQVFERMRGQMDEQLPDDAPSWIVSRYEQMVQAAPPPKPSRPEGLQATDPAGPPFRPVTNHDEKAPPPCMRGVTFV